MDAAPKPGGADGPPLDEEALHVAIDPRREVRSVSGTCWIQLDSTTTFVPPAAFGSSDLGRCSLLLCFPPLDLPRMMCNHTVDGINQAVQINRIAGVENGKTAKGASSSLISVRVRFRSAMPLALVSLCSPKPIWWRYTTKDAMQLSSSGNPKQ